MFGHHYQLRQLICRQAKTCYMLGLFLTNTANVIVMHSHSILQCDTVICTQQKRWVREYFTLINPIKLQSKVMSGETTTSV